MDLLLLGTVFDGLKNLILAESGSQVVDVAVGKAKGWANDKKLEKAFYSCGDFASHFENSGTDEFGQFVLSVFSEENLFSLYQEIKKKPGYN